jgi:hypothetical protein
MRYNRRNVLLSLCFILVGISLIGCVAAQNTNQSGQSGMNPALAYPGSVNAVEGSSENVGAYPSEPVSLNPSEVMGDYSLAPVGAYPTQPTSIAPVPFEQPSGEAYLGTATDTGAVDAAYYTQAPSEAQQNVLLSYDVQAAPPNAVYYGGSYVPWATFYPSFQRTPAPMLWILTRAGWSWHATCPLGGWVREQMYIPSTGTLKIYELYPNGMTKYHNYGWVSRGYKYIWFYADTPGRHTTIFTISDRPSNWVAIDVF